MRTVLITGGSKGLGLAFVKQFLLQGFQVYTCSRTAPPINDPNLLWQQVDFSDSIAVQNYIEFVSTNLENLDLLINNIGIYSTDEDYLRFYKFNTLHPILLTEALLQKLTLSKGQIINICSVTQYQTKPEAIAYAVSKNALYTYGKNLIQKYKSKLRVCNIILGATNTSSWEGFPYPEKLIDPEEVAKLVAFISKESPSLDIEEIILQPRQNF